MMSEKDYSCAISSKAKTLGVCGFVNNNNNNISAEDSADKCVSNNSSSRDRDLRERVLKEVGLTSSTFIGPAFPPKATTVKADIEDTLSEFYKELEKIDAPDGANVNSEKQDAGFVRPSMQPRASASKELQYAHNNNNNNTSRPAGTDAYQRSSGQKQTSWPHRYQNEPYYPRRPRSPSYIPAYHQQHYPQAPNRPPNPRFHRPPSHRPPPPSAFPNPHMNHSWSGSDVMRQYREECNFPPFSRFPPTYECSHPSQGFHEDTPHHRGRDEQGYNHDAQPDRVNAGWSRDTQEEWSQSGEGYDQRQRSDSANELWQQQQHHCRPPDNTRAHYSSSVLILMRGLPGSGKSTKSRELLSTGPSGLILSTDDYFAHKDGYHYEPTLLGVAHEWNQSRAKDAMHDGWSPIIIDNTNIQAWEMKPYVKMALETGYRVDFCEPDTCWKFDSYELEKRNKHGVPQEKIAQMLDRFSFPISIDVVMSSQEPPHVNQRRRPEQAHMMRENRGFY